MNDNLNEETIKKLVEALGTLTETVQPLIEEEQKNADAAKKSGDRLTFIGKQLGLFSDSVIDAAKAMTSADEGTGKYGRAIENASSSVANIAGQFGLLGKGAGLLINLFGALAGGALKQNEALVKTYKGLAEAGDLGNTSFKNLASDLQKAGFSAAEGGQQFVNIIKQNSEGLAAFGGGVSEGRRRLTDMFDKSGALGEFEYTLARLGYSTEDSFKHAAFWSGQLALSGQTSKLTNAQLGAVTKEYLVNLAALNELTGQSRDSMEARMKQQQNDLRWQMHLSQQDADVAANLRLMVASMPGYADELKSIIVNNGQVVDQFGAKMLMASGPKGIGAVLNTAKASAEDFPQAMANLRVQLGSIFDNNIKNFTTTGRISNEAMNNLGFTAEKFAEAAAARASDPKKFAEQWKALLDKMKENEMDRNTELKKQQRVGRNAFEQLEIDIADGLLPAISKFQTAMLGLGKKFAEILHRWGGPDLRDLFVNMSDLSEVTETLARKQQEEIRLKEEMANIESSNSMLAGFISNLEAQKKQQGAKFGQQGALDTYKNTMASNNARMSQLQNDLSTVQKTTSSFSQAQSGLVAEKEANAQAASKKAGELVKFSGGVTGNSLDGLAPNVRSQFEAMVAEYGKQVTVNSAWRSQEVQRQMFNEWKAAGGDYGTNKTVKTPTFGNLTIPTDGSVSDPHTRGKAIDIDKNSFYQLMSSGLLSKYGFSTVAGDDGHIQGARTGGMFSGPNSGYPVMLHGREAVVPMNKFRNFFKGMGTDTAKNVDKRELSSVKTEYSSSVTTDMSRLIDNLMSMMSAKFDDMIYEQRQTKNAQEQLLTHAKH